MTAETANPAAPKEVYDRYWSLLSEEIDASEKDRLGGVVSLVPAEARSLLDAGCGDGRLLRLLRAEGRRAIGVDFSLSALSKIDGGRAQSRLESLPFDDGAFDLVATCDVLEHVDDALHPAVLRELLRVSRKWVLVNTPYREPFHWAAVRCPGCRLDYHSYQHLRRYSRETYLRLFGEGASLRRSVLCGARVLHYPAIPFALAARMQWGANGRSSCPRCGAFEARQPATTKAIRAVTLPFVYQFNKLGIPPFTRRSEIAALFEKHSGGSA